MGKFWLGVGLLLASLALGLWITHDMCQVHDNISQTLTQAADQALKGEMEQGATLAEQARHLWQQRRNATATVADHVPMDDIDSLFAQLDGFAQSGEEWEFAALCSQLAMRVRSMGEAHRLTWYNLLCFSLCHRQGL